jgi:ribosomal protein S18 acetylase RimI-like enzyme
MNIKIETATIKQLNKLYEIEKQSFQHEAFSKKMISYLLTDYNSVSLMARADGEVVGIAIGKMEENNRKIHGHIFTLETLEAHRRKGVAQKLLSTLETLFAEKGAVESHLEVREDNEAAISLYNKLGYRQVSKLEGYYGKAHGLYLKKNLAPLNANSGKLTE